MDWRLWGAFGLGLGAVVCFATLKRAYRYFFCFPEQYVPGTKERSVARYVHADLNPLMFKSATELARMIRNKEISSSHITELYIEQIEKVNPALNAVVLSNFERTRAEARQYDRILAEWDEKMELPPYFGVPITVKECFDFIGNANSSGLLSRATRVATEDATAIERLKKAGFIILGSTNLSELCMWMESNNNVYGLTKNPYNLQRTAGGSSGGEASIIAACGSPLGLGSDVGGSIRMPAFFTGIFGHKPTGGVVPDKGQYPPSSRGIQRFCQAGPMCRYSEDMWPFLNLLVGPDDTNSKYQIEPPWWHNPSWRPENVDFRKIKYYSVESSRHALVSKVDPEITKAQRNLVTFLRNEGCEVEELVLPELRDSVDMWMAEMTLEEDISFTALMADGRKVNMWAELVKFFFNKSDFTLPGILLSLVENVPNLIPARTKSLSVKNKKFSQKLTEMLGDNAVILYPSHPVPAPKHRWPMAHPFNWSYTAVFNTLELPVTQIPLGLTDDERAVPVGLQIVGAHGRDHVTIAIAEQLEKAYAPCRWVPPRKI